MSIIGCHECLVEPCICQYIPRIGGVGPETETCTNAAGGKQSDIPFRCDLLPPMACLAVSNVLSLGAEKYGEDNWRQIPASDHVNHALMHLFSWLAEDQQDEHLEHAACRLLMALEMHLGDK